MAKILKFPNIKKQLKNKTPKATHCEPILSLTLRIHKCGLANYNIEILEGHHKQIIDLAFALDKAVTRVLKQGN